MTSQAHTDVFQPPPRCFVVEASRRLTQRLLTLTLVSECSSRRRGPCLQVPGSAFCPAVCLLDLQGYKYVPGKEISWKQAKPGEVSAQPFSLQSSARAPETAGVGPATATSFLTVENFFSVSNTRLQKPPIAPKPFFSPCSYLAKKWRTN